MGVDVCYTGHAEADQDDMDALLTLLGAADVTYVMGVPGADDVMLSYHCASFRDALYLRGDHSAFAWHRNSRDWLRPQRRHLRRPRWSDQMKPVDLSLFGLGYNEAAVTRCRGRGLRYHARMRRNCAPAHYRFLGPG